MLTHPGFEAFFALPRCEEVAAFASEEAPVDVVLPAPAAEHARLTESMPPQSHAPHSKSVFALK